MTQDASIRQNPHPSVLPNFRYVGVWVRVIAGANLCGLFSVLIRNRDVAMLAREIGEMAARLEPSTLLSLLVLYFLTPALRRMSYRYGMGWVVAMAMIFAVLAEFILAEIQRQPPGWGGYLRVMALAAATAGLLLVYFSYRHRLRSPAFSEARLMALTARIRPHFLFNSLNAVLGVIRTDPQRAEAALEELAELFRVLMRENRELTPLSEEIALARQYLDLERLRLGERLQVIWDIESCPPDTLVPPLMLQPLLENAVYHGIEPSPAPGTVTIRFGRHDSRVRIELINPCGTGAGHVRGNQLALANIRERLELFFGMDAVLAAGARNGDYHVVIDIPFFSSIKS